MLRSVLSYVLEVVGVLLVAFVAGFNFGWSWGLLPVAVYLLVLGVTMDGGRS